MYGSTTNHEATKYCCISYLVLVLSTSRVSMYGSVVEVLVIIFIAPISGFLHHTMMPNYPIPIPNTHKLY